MEDELSERCIEWSGIFLIWADRPIMMNSVLFFVLCCYVERFKIIATPMNSAGLVLTCTDAQNVQ